MLTCFALAALGAVSLSDIPALAAEVETEARELTIQTEITPAFIAELEDFSADAERLSAALRQAEVEQDLPCIFHGIAEDARERTAELQAARGAEDREAAFAGLRVLLDDAILIAPMAGAAAADAAARQTASR